MAKGKTMYKSALHSTHGKHGSPMGKGGAHQAPTATKKVSPERKGTARSKGKLTAM